jgi:ABC-type branched-subunit amino acid transport system ATPase component
MHLLETKQLGRTFGSFTAVKDVGLRVRLGEVHALIGPNGAGKTTLLNLLAGALRPTTGRILLNEEDVTELPIHARAKRGLGRSYQVVKLFEGITCLKAAELAVQRDRPLRSWVTAAGRLEIRNEAQALLDKFGLSAHANDDTSTLAHGTQKLLEIALALSIRASLLLLDEPMAGLAPQERSELASTIRALTDGRAVVIVEHDIDMVMSLADTVSVLHNGELIASGSPDEVRANELVQRVYLHREKPHD